MLKQVENYRSEFAKNISKKLIKEKFTIISDDCWGGQIYRQLLIPYYTPTVGLWIGGDDYFRFIENLHAPDATDIFAIKSKATYPIGQSPYAKFHFLHYENFDIAKETFIRRYQRINWDNLLYKIDLEKPVFELEHVRRWNELKLPNSIAFYSNRVLENWGDEIHNGLYIKNWSIDGAAMFDISRSYFNIFQWLDKGYIQKSLMYSLMNFLIYDPTTLKKLKKIKQSIQQRL